MPFVYLLSCNRCLAVFVKRDFGECSDKGCDSSSGSSGSSGNDKGSGSDGSSSDESKRSDDNTSPSTGEQQPSNPVTPTDDGSKKPDNPKDGKDGQVGVCVIGIKSPCNGQPFDHSQKPIIHRPPSFNVKHGISNKDILFINIHNRIHSSSSSSSNSGSTSISKTCLDVINITWLAKIYNGQNHEVDDVIDK